MNKTLISILKFLVFFGFGALILYLSYQNFNRAFLEECALKGIPESECSLVNKLIEDFKGSNFFWLAMVILSFMLSNVLRALRWNQLLEPIGHKPRLVNTMGATMIGYLANLGLPRMGEIIKPGILTTYDKVPIEVGIGTIIVDRILDIICLVVLIGIAVLLSFNTFKNYFIENFDMDLTYLFAVLGILAILGIVVFILILKLLKTKIDEERKILVKVKTTLEGFVQGLISIRDVKNLPLLIVYSILIWVLYYLMTYICFFAFGATSHLGPIAGLVVCVFGTLGMVFPSPGGMGSYHLLVSQALIIYGINNADAFSFSNIIFFTIQLFGVILFGIIFLIILPLVNKKSKHIVG
ncbi:MAG: flippase-like domain-containing protein [Saprospiraceae bacterium]|nr:flippase-like domain-containing protein [Bacteroidia bacterium]NNF20856.1 flippase-like domain-containing protein [Saprospiraceae bacterium]NNK89428.1 flippase-like domain-containing protein [Saprospiraceae bacterium]